MFNVFRNFSLELAKLAAFDRSFANVEFTPTGEILSANSIFCDLMGYSHAELKGARHSLFVEPQEAKSASHREFWQKLARGEFISGEFRRIRKNGAAVYIRGVYNPILDSKGRVLRVVKVASDVTRERRAELESAAKLDAIGKMQAVVEFSPEGLILSINDGALAMVGYERHDVIGKPHSVLVDPQYAESAEYRDFWTRLRAGESVSGNFPRVGKGGKRLLVNGSYNPIRDIDGTLVKIVKFANDLSDLSVLGDALAAVAQGDLSRRIDSNFTPSFEKLKRDFNSTVDAIGGALGRIFGSINVVGDVTEQIASVSEMLAKRTEEQAANLEEAAAALDEVSATVNFTSANANRANEAVERAKSDAEKGDDVVSRAVEAMGRIENSSRQIASIIGVIDEIAFQTNLLALNAGVEAARAGDAGRGFAVVAAEVRALAQRSAGAAKQIKTLISASGADVASGVKLVSETGSSLKLIIEQVMEISSLVVEITKGAHEETAIVQEVNSAVNLVDEATQQNAAMAEETTAAVVSMQRQVEELLAAVGEFRLGGSAGEGGRQEADKYSYAA